MSDESQALETSSFEAADNAPTETPVAVAKPETKTAKVEATAPADPMKAILDRLDKFEASHNTLAGHIGGLNRSQQELKNTLAAAQAATNRVSDAPTQAQVKEAIQDPKEWADLKATYPEWAGATEKIIDAKVKSQGVDQAAIDKIVSDRVAGEAAAVRKEMIDSHLDAIVDGDWMKEVQSPEFTAWMASQPDDIKALGDSFKMTDASKMLRLYGASKQITPVASPVQPKEVSARQKRIEAAVNPRGSGGNATASNSAIDYMEAGYSGT